MITPEPTPPGRPSSLRTSTRKTAGATMSATLDTAREYASRISVSEAGGATASPMSPTSDDEAKSSIGSRGFCGTWTYVGAHRRKWKMRRERDSTPSENMRAEDASDPARIQAIG